MEYAELEYRGGREFLAKNRSHTLIIDLPESGRGADKGPTPPETFIDALGACVGVYTVSYCNNTGINTEGLKIKVGWEKDTSKRPYYIKKIDVKIILPHADVGARKEALLKVARSCLLHETIKRQPEIGIELS